MNVQSLVRATVGRGLIISSEARSALGIRAPADVGNLLKVWGLGQERAVEAQTVNPRQVVMNEAIKRSGFRGVVDVVEGGERPVGQKDGEKDGKGQGKGQQQQGGKRKGGQDEPPQMSKRQQKKLRLEALAKESGTGVSTPSNT